MSDAVGKTGFASFTPYYLVEIHCDWCKKLLDVYQPQEEDNQQFNLTGCIFDILQGCRPPFCSSSLFPFAFGLKHKEWLIVTTRIRQSQAVHQPGMPSLAFLLCPFPPQFPSLDGSSQDGARPRGAGVQFQDVPAGAGGRCNADGGP